MEATALDALMVLSVKDNRRRILNLWRKVCWDKRILVWRLKLVPTTDALVVKSEREVWFGEYAENPLRLVLHEVAHIITNSPPPGHCVKWWQCYRQLLREYLPGRFPTPSDYIAYLYGKDHAASAGKESKGMNDSNLVLALAIEKLITAMGYHAANTRRAQDGEALAYHEGSFEGLAYDIARELESWKERKDT